MSLQWVFWKFLGFGEYFGHFLGSGRIFAIFKFREYFVYTLGLGGILVFSFFVSKDIFVMF